MDNRTEKKLLEALASLDAAFPAGDYGLCPLQNIAINDILDVSSAIAKKHKAYAELLERMRADVSRKMTYPPTYTFDMS